MNEWIKGLKRPLLIGLAAGVVTALLSLRMPNIYRSEAKILPVETRGSSSMGGLAAAAAAFGVAVPGGEGSDANAVDILQSRPLLEALVLKEYSFKIPSWYFGREKVCTQTLYEHLKAKNLDRAIKRMNTLLVVNRDLKSKVLSLAAETGSPDLSQQVVTHAVFLLESFLVKKNRTRGGAKAAFAEARLKDARAEFEDSESGFRRFLGNNRNYLTSIDPDVRILGGRLEMELKLRQQLVTTLTLSREQALMEEKNDMPILNVLEPGNLPLEKSRPARASMVLLVTLLVAAGAWAWANRIWLLKNLRPADSEGN